jgi:hypothetical protein
MNDEDWDELDIEDNELLVFLEDMLDTDYNGAKSPFWTEPANWGYDVEEMMADVNGDLTEIERRKVFFSKLKEKIEEDG